MPGRFVVGMRRLGGMWWEDGDEYLKVMKEDGPCVLMGLGTGPGGQEPELAKRLYAALASDVRGVDGVDMALVPEKLDPFWDDLAVVVKALRTKGGSRGK